MRLGQAAQRQIARGRGALRQGEAFPQHVHSPATTESSFTATACCAFLHRLGMIYPQRFEPPVLLAGLIHRGAAGRAQIALVAMQAGGDGADIGDFAGAKPVDIGGAGPPLLGRANRKGRRGRNQGQPQTDHGGETARGHMR